MQSEITPVRDARLTTKERAILANIYNIDPRTSRRGVYWCANVTNIRTLPAVKGIDLIWRFMRREKLKARARRTCLAIARKLIRSL